jgi:hypothetical protein
MGLNLEAACGALERGVMERKDVVREFGESLRAMMLVDTIYQLQPPDPRRPLDPVRAVRPQSPVWRADA